MRFGVAMCLLPSRSLHPRLPGAHGLPGCGGQRRGRGRATQTPTRVSSAFGLCLGGGGV